MTNHKSSTQMSCCSDGSCNTPAISPAFKGLLWPSYNVHAHNQAQYHGTASWPHKQAEIESTIHRAEIEAVTCLVVHLAMNFPDGPHQGFTESAGCKEGINRLKLDHTEHILIFSPRPASIEPAVEPVFHKMKLRILKMPRIARVCLISLETLLLIMLRRAPKQALYSSTKSLRVQTM